MKLLAISVLRYSDGMPEPVLLVQATHLMDFGFFQRGSVKEMITFFNKTIAKRAPAGRLRDGRE